LDLEVFAEGKQTQGRLAWNGHSVPCALGRSGIVSEKREGDGGTPAGRLPLRRLLYRADRLSRPRTGLPAAAIAETDGWCDDPGDPAYNRPVRLPYPGHHEVLWREDELYDLLVVLGYNDAPVAAGRGSAIFLHLARAGYPPTEGCVALAKPDLLRLLEEIGLGDELRIHAP
jgi:L,D-peptidoglycan transpeptidase YkuD (ErfK/YbiS/YcfS/YnhG family)